MTTKPTLPLWQLEATTAIETITQALERAARYSTTRPEAIFSDWLKLVEATLHSLPVCPAIGQLMYGPEGVAQLIQGALYGEATPPPDPLFTHLATATETLLLSSLGGYQDVLGSTYMAFAALNQYAAQFFTPWHVA